MVSDVALCWVHFHNKSYGQETIENYDFDFSLDPELNQQKRLKHKYHNNNERFRQVYVDSTKIQLSSLSYLQPKTPKGKKHIRLCTVHLYVS